VFIDRDFRATAPGAHLGPARPDPGAAAALQLAPASPQSPGSPSETSTSSSSPAQSAGRRSWNSSSNYEPSSSASCSSFGTGGRRTAAAWCAITSTRPTAPCRLNSSPRTPRNSIPWSSVGVLEAARVGAFLPERFRRTLAFARNRLRRSQHRPKIIAACWAQAEAF
jgi:hypothetical protein